MVNALKKNLLWITSMVLLSFSVLNIAMTGTAIAQANHDIAVTSVTPSATFVKSGELVNITVATKNKGTETETFNVTLYYDTTAIEMKNVSNLAAGLSKSLVFTWDTTNLREEIYATTEKEKTYNVTAVASTLPGETNTVDNTLTSPNKIRVILQYIAVIPQNTVDLTLTPGKNYTISIYTDYNGSDVWCWQFALSYNPNVLEGVEVVNGDLITTAKDSSASFFKGTFNNTEGTLSLTAAYFYYIPPAEPYVTSGPGTLAYITFRVKATGESNIILSDKSKLQGPEAEYEIINYYLPAADHIVKGKFRNIETAIHDIAIASVTPSPTSVVAGELVSIAVVVENQGTVAETFDVKVHNKYDPTFPHSDIIQTKTVKNLAAGSSETLTFSWNTTDAKADSYRITAIASQVTDETDTDDNMLQSSETIIVKAREARALPITEILIGIVVIVVPIAVIVFALRRRKRQAPE